MRTVAIVGVGLIGASFGLAIRKGGFKGGIVGVSSAPAIEAGVACGAITSGVTLERAVELADLIYLAQPVDRILETLTLLGPIARKETLVTDAGSTKVAIVERATQQFRQARFLGGHPMAGKETRGAQSADADLFRGRPYVITGDAPTAFGDLLNSIGANVLKMSPDEHDATVALTSHLPQLISTALAGFLARQNGAHIQQVFGPGLVDMTRLAMSPLDLWQSILETNQENAGLALEYFAQALLDLKSRLKSADLRTVFDQASEFAASLRKPLH